MISKKGIITIIFWFSSMNMFCQVNLADHYQLDEYKNKLYGLFLNFPDASSYCMYFEEDFGDDNTQIGLLSFGSYTYNEYTVILTDNRNNFKIILHKQKDILKVDEGFRFLKNMSFKEMNYYGNICDYFEKPPSKMQLESTSDNLILKINGKFQEELSKSHIEFYENNRFTFYCYVLTNLRIPLLSGTWTNSSNVIRLCDTSLKVFFYIIYENENSLRNVSMPTIENDIIFKKIPH